MPNLASGVATNALISLVATNGNTFTLTKAEIQAYYRDFTSGSAATRKAAVIAWIKDQIVTALGEGICAVDHLDVDLSVSSDTEPIFLGVRND